MASYISSRDNRFYVAVEQQFGVATAITSGDRFPVSRITPAPAAQMDKDDT